MAHAFPVITQEAIDQLKAKIGERRPVADPFNEYAAKDTIKHFVHGIGDTNPLFTDAEYADKTRYGHIIAPPCFLFTMIGWNYPRGLPGIHGMWSGAEFESYLPIKVDDRIRAVVYLSKIEEKVGSFAGRAIFQEWTNEFTNQENKLVANVKQWSMRTERDSAREKGKLKTVSPHRYKEEDIKEIERCCLAERVRGANPRFWEDVDPGDDLDQIVKGPLTVTDNVAWKIGWGNRPFTFAHRIALEYMKRHPAAGIKNDMGVSDVPERVHWDNDFAREVGVPAAYDFGPQRLSWMGQLITNWMGDDGFIVKLRGEIRGFNLVGDTTWCKGKVVEKYEKGNQYAVRCEIWAENQRDERTVRGEAIVVLPSRDRAVWPIDDFKK